MLINFHAISATIGSGVHRLITIRLVRILRLNAAYLFFFLAFLYRIPNITSFVNDDDSLWKYRGYKFATAIFDLKFADTAVTYHPGVPLMWSQMFAIKTFSIIDKLYFKGTLYGSTEFFYNHLIQNIYLLLITSALIAIIFVFIRRIINERFAIIAVLVIMLEPFFISLGRSIHNDLLMSLFTYIGFLSFFMLVSTYHGGNILKRRLTLVTALFSALALLTKSGALFIVPLYLSVIGLYSILYIKYTLRYVKLFLIVAIYTCGFFIIIWPAMWVNPGYTLWLYFYKGILDTAIEEGHAHYWFGQVTMDPGVWFYPIVLIGRFTPVIFIGFIGGVFIFLKSILKKIKSLEFTDTEKFLFLNLVFFIGFFVMLSITSKKLDRYLLAEIFPMGVFCAYFISYFMKSYRSVLYALFVLFIITRVMLLAYIHPNYLVYYSPFIGGSEKGRIIIEPKWVIGFDKVAEYLNSENSKADHKIEVVTPDAHLLSYFANFKTTYPENVGAIYGEYYVVPVWKELSSSSMISKFELTPDNLVKTIYIAGIEYYDIYKKDR